MAFAGKRGEPVSDFPTTQIGGKTVSRLVIGSNFILGFSHRSVAKDQFIRASLSDHKKIADLIEAFLRRGVNAIIADMSASQTLRDGIEEAENRVGREVVRISTPGFACKRETVEKGFDLDQVAKVLDDHAGYRTGVCMPHSSVTDTMLDKCARKVRHMETVCRMIRERGMIPGLSTHAPETIVMADESGLDVETYISILNSAGFLMQWETDWTLNTIHKAKKPVLTIKPLASGKLPPLEGLTFVWNSIRQQDMVAVGTMSPAEAEEVVEMSLRILNRQPAVLQLQVTRSKASAGV